MNIVMFMKELLNKLKNFFKWLSRWLKYIIIIIIGSIYSLFKKEETPKIEKIKKELKPIKKENRNNIIKLPNENPNSLIQNSIFKPTKEILKEEILIFYCKEKNIKKYELEKQDEKIIEYLEEKLIPILEKEILKKYIETKELLEEQIKKLGTDELLVLEEKKKIPTLLINERLEKQNENSSNLVFSNPTYQSYKEKIIPQQIEKATSISAENLKPKTNQETSTINMNPFNPSLNLEKEEKYPNQEIETLVQTTPLIISTAILKEELEKPQSDIKQSNEEIKEYTLEAMDSKEKVKEIQEEKNETSLKEEKQENKQEKAEEKQDEKKSEEVKFISINLYPIENETKRLELEKLKLEEKREFEDKNYDELLLRVENLLKEIEKIKTLNLKPEDKKQVLASESKLKNLQNNIENKKAIDLEAEKTLLEENITEEEITGLLENLKKLHLEHQIDLNEHLINKAEELENLSKEKVERIEKELIKIKLEKASRSLELSSLILLPFIRNRYFFMFTAGIFVNNHFKLLDHLLKHKSVPYTPPLLEHIKKGRDSLEEALNLTVTNLSYLNYLEQNILSKYPKLSLDEEYLLYINKLRYSLLKNEEKLLKKKQTIEKYNLKYQIKIRKLKKKKKVA